MLKYYVIYLRNGEALDRLPEENQKETIKRSIRNFKFLVMAMGRQENTHYINV